MFRRLFFYVFSFMLHHIFIISRKNCFVAIILVVNCVCLESLNFIYIRCNMWKFTSDFVVLCEHFCCCCLGCGFMLKTAVTCTTTVTQKKEKKRLNPLEITFHSPFFVGVRRRGGAPAVHVWFFSHIHTHGYYTSLHFSTNVQAGIGYPHWVKLNLSELWAPKFYSYIPQDSAYSIVNLSAM